MADPVVLADDAILKKALLAAALFAFASGLALLMYWLQIPQPQGPSSLQLRPSTIEEKADVLKNLSESTAKQPDVSMDEKLRVMESLSQSQPTVGGEEATTTVHELHKPDATVSGGMSDEEKLKILSGLKSR